MAQTGIRLLYINPGNAYMVKRLNRVENQFGELFSGGLR